MICNLDKLLPPRAQSAPVQDNHQYYAGLSKDFSSQDTK